jgi:ribosomal protein L11
MGFDAKAFAAAFATEIAGGIKERTKEAKEYKEKQEELAQRNLPIFQKRKAQKDVLLGYARTLQKMGAKPKDIMYYMRLGPSAFQTLHKHITQKAAAFKKASNGDELSKEAVMNMMKMPEEFEGTIQEQGFEEFLDKAYRLSSENDKFEAPVTEEISTGNLLKGMLGIGAKERTKQKLKTEKFLGNLSVDQINRVASQQDFLDPYGGQDMPVLDLTTGPVILDYDTQERIKERATNKYNTATSSVTKVAPLIESYMAKNGVTADTLQLGDADFLSAKSRIAKALVNEDISGLESDEEINIYNEVRDRAKFDTFKDAAGGRVSGDTVKFFGAEVEELFDKFETKVGQSDASTTQRADEADYTEAQFDVAMENNQIPPGTYKVLSPNGVVQEIKVEDDDVNLDQPKDNTNVVTTQGVMSQEEFDALPDDVGDPPGTMLTPSGATRDARDEWFEKYGDTHSTTGKKKTYQQYRNTVDPASSPNPYGQYNLSDLKPGGLG